MGEKGGMGLLFSCFLGSWGPSLAHMLCRSPGFLPCNLSCYGCALNPRVHVIHTSDVDTEGSGDTRVRVIHLDVIIPKQQIQH